MKVKKEKQTNPNARHKLVIDEYYNNGMDGMQAWMFVYPKSTKASAATSFVGLRNDQRYDSYFKKKQSAASRKINMTHEGILQELKNWIESDITDFLGLTIEEIKLLPIEIRRFMKGHKQTNRDLYDSKGKIKETITTITMTFESKTAALDMVNKHIGFYEKDNKQKSVNVDLQTQTTAELLARAKAIKEISKNE